MLICGLNPLPVWLENSCEDLGRNNDFLLFRFVLYIYVMASVGRKLPYCDFDKEKLNTRVFLLLVHGEHPTASSLPSTLGNSEVPLWIEYHHNRWRTYGGRRETARSYYLLEVV